VSVLGQSTDSLNKHSVKKATIYSAVIPGAGQIYNHAGLLGTGSSIISNNSLRKAYRQEYDYRIATNTSSNFFEYDNAGLLTLHNEARSKRDLFIAAFGLVYLLNVVDAGIEAHFVSFDVSENLNISFRPVYGINQGMGFATTLKFR
jgi:hypothetical protein